MGDMGNRRVGRPLKHRKKYPNVKQILKIASIGAILAGSLVFPQLPRLLRGRPIRYEDFLPETEWEDFDERRLKQRLGSLYKQKEIKIYKMGDKFAVQITKKGKRKLLRYKLEEIETPEPKQWDGKWRMVVYDVPEEKKSAREAIRITLKRLGFYELQKSVYLFPHPCHEVIEFLRELYGIGEHVTLFTVGYLENEVAYKEYFDL